MKKFLWGMVFLPAISWGVSYPDGKLTPGKANPVLTKDVICAPEFRTGPYRHVTEGTKKKVFKEYGILWGDRAKFEVDHLISLELGGSNDIANLWPEAYLPVPGAHQKDVVENWLHQEVCEGRMSLAQAQEEISTDWYVVYEQAVGGK